MLSNTTLRADITVDSSTTIQFSTTTALAERPIRLWAPSGRQATISTPTAALTISGTAGTRYVYARLAPPHGNPYATTAPGVLSKLLQSITFNRLDFHSALRAIHPGDGSLSDTARMSVVSLVETDSATAPDAHHVPLGQFECASGEITSIASYENQNEVVVSALLHGQCVLSRQSSTLLILMPKDGQSLVIDDTTRSVPTAGVTLSSSGLTANTAYHIYATYTGSGISLVASTTAPTTHTNGVEIKTGDSTHTYVGSAFIEPGVLWSTIVPVKSRFNDPTPDVLIRYCGNPAYALESSTTETSIFGTVTPQIPGGVLGTDEHLELTLFGEFDNAAGGNRHWDLRCYYGGTMILSIVGGDRWIASVASGTRGWHFIGYLGGAGATNAQIARGYTVDGVAAGISGDPVVGGTGVDANHMHLSSSHSSIAVDSTVPQTFDITVEPEIAHAALRVRVYSCILRRKRA